MRTTSSRRGTSPAPSGTARSVSTAVDHVTFKIKDRDIVSLVGQSGCGKTVLAKMLLRLETPTSGELLFNGKPIDDANDPRDHWRQVQAVFQDPFSAFNQFFTIRAQLKSSFQLFKEKPSDARDGRARRSGAPGGQHQAPAKSRANTRSSSRAVRCSACSWRASSS